MWKILSWFPVIFSVKHFFYILIFYPDAFRMCTFSTREWASPSSCTQVMGALQPGWGSFFSWWEEGAHWRPSQLCTGAYLDECTFQVQSNLCSNWVWTDNPGLARQVPSVLSSHHPNLRLLYFTFLSAGLCNFETLFTQRWHNAPECKKCSAGFEPTTSTQTLHRWQTSRSLTTTPRRCWRWNRSPIQLDASAHSNLWTVYFLAYISDYSRTAKSFKSARFENRLLLVQKTLLISKGNWYAGSSEHCMNESKTFIYVSVSTVQVKHGRAQEANSIRQPFTLTLCVVKLGSQ